MLSPLSPKPDCKVSCDKIDILSGAEEYKQQLLKLIANAKQRIYITALYLQDDEAGNDVVSALLAAKQQLPTLDIKVFVDYHRAQRGLIGEKQSEGNRALYLKIAQQFPQAIAFYGVPVKGRELFGVLHLKGMVFDDTLLYSGASINNVYCQQQGKYRLDRYHLIQSTTLSNSFVDFIYQVFLQGDTAIRLDMPSLPEPKQVNAKTKRLKRLVKAHPYRCEISQMEDGELIISPLVGLGKRGNLLNAQILKLVNQCQQTLVVFTPYFNFPKSLTKAIRRALKRGVNICIVVGDKTANDFYIPPEQTFSTIGILPYAYEQMLRAFVKQQSKYLASGQLQVRLWRDGENSFHLKGMVSDDSLHLLTGNNFNPRAWGLDLENGLLIDDRNQQLTVQWHMELAAILQHTIELESETDIDSPTQYPDKVKRLWRRLHVSQVDRILKRFL